jgi:histone acetyltransferase (RNA polymerase elongator complex component)
MPHQMCPFRCIYCDQYLITNTTEISWNITIENVKNFIKKHHDKDKEIAFYGGSFTYLHITEINSLFQKILPWCDDRTFFRISTRPEAIDPDILDMLKKNRVNTIELGVQSFSDTELKATQRGYSAQVAKNSCSLILSHGFRLSVQLLIGLPSACPDSYRHTCDTLSEILPDYVRLYPLLVIKDTKLHSMYTRGEYTPLSVDEAVDICYMFYTHCITYGIKVIKIGLHPDINTKNLIAGPYHERFGELVKNKPIARTPTV